MNTSSAPVVASQRAASVDILRGIALCGILFMNIIAFGRYEAEYMNPAAAGPLEGTNLWAWLATFVFADMKFISIFSMLFGAGLVLMGDRIEQREGATGFAGVYYRRVAWLLLFGMLHAWLLWHGDILVSYALCGFVLYPLRKLPARVLIIIGASALVIPVLIFGGLGALVTAFDNSAQIRDIIAAQNRGEVLTPEQQAMLTMSASQGEWYLTQQSMDEQRAAMTGSWLDIFWERAKINLFMQVFMIPTWSFWRCGGLMLIGMAMMKSGVFTAARSTRFYGLLVAIGLAAGLPLTLLAAWDGYRDGFTQGRFLLASFNLNYVGSIGMALAYVGVVMLLYRASILRESSLVGRSFAAMGRMAFTNYLMQTLICTTIFYGYGFGYFAAWERWQLVAMVVPAVLLVQLIYSPLWLSRFRMGPAEWLWRSLTYLRAQRMVEVAGART